MICTKCSEAALLGSSASHEQCVNVGRVRPHDGAQDTTWCDCQHRTGTARYIQPEALEKMPNPPIPPLPTFSHKEE
jgi:hypothetical protein